MKMSWKTPEKERLVNSLMHVLSVLVLVTLREFSILCGSSLCSPKCGEKSHLNEVNV